MPSDKSNERCNHEGIATFYNEIYYRDAQPPKYQSAHLRRLAASLDLSKGMSVLDVACGAGEWLSVVSSQGGKVSGIDISARAIEVCRKGITEGEFFVGPAETLPFDDSVFDLVTCLGSLEHFLDQPMALREMRRVLRPGGRLLLLVPNANFLTYRLGFYRGTHQQAVRETIRYLDEWALMLNAAGFDIKKRWRDLHILDKKWLFRKPWFKVPVRLVQGVALLFWPLEWQYQVYHLCTVKE